MFKELPKANISVRPFKVYKQWQLDETAIVPLYGVYTTGSFYDAETDDVNADGTSKRLLYDTIKVQGYYNPETSSILTEIGYRTSYTNANERSISNVIGVIPIPQIQYGEGVKPNSVTLTYDSITVTDDGKSNLVDSGGNHKGNIFYSNGLVVITQDVEDDVTLSSFDLSFKSTVTIYENEILVSVLENEFNVSQNPTAYEYDTKKIKYTGITSSLDPSKSGGFGDYFYSSSVDPTGSYLTPFITTIGLYDNDNNMVAVAKLPRPIKCLPDYPINFLIRFDA